MRAWIRFDPSTHSSANNHRIGELAGLATIGLLAPELATSDEITSLALAELSAEVGRQIAQTGPEPSRPLPITCSSSTSYSSWPR